MWVAVVKLIGEVHTGGSLEGVQVASLVFTLYTLDLCYSSLSKGLKKQFDIWSTKIQ